MKRTKLLLSVIFILAGFISSAQLKKFTKDKQLFMDELKTVFEKNKNDEIEALLLNISYAWDSTLTDEEKDKIISTANDLLDRKARITPHIVDYIKTYLVFKGSNKAKESMAEWEEGLEYIIKKKKLTLNNIADYFEITTKLLSSNTIFSNSSVKWTSSNDHFMFVFDKTIKILFDVTDLTCYAIRDSIKIFNARGEFDPVENIWAGNKGLVTWERAGYDRNNIKAELKNYRIEMQSYGYIADSVTFTNTTYFEQPILGIMEDKVKIITSPEKATYPQFNSYAKRFKINNLYENINYDGGFTMRGAKVIGAGNAQENVFLYFLRGDKVFMKASSEFFVFSKEKIVSTNTSVVFYVKSDSVFHPGISLTYLVEKKEMTLTPTEGILSQSPFYNTYHKISMRAEQLSWKTLDTIINLSALRASTIGNAVFESMNYYNQLDYEKLQRMDEIHPLEAIRNFAGKNKTEDFTANEFARYMKKNVEEIRQLLMGLTFDGFIFYDLNTDVVKINQRLYDYLDARVGKIDYDVMKFVSVVENPVNNASLNLNNFDLKINGIPEIFLSDSQNVSIFPKNGQIIMKKNRDFNFDGEIDAGLFSFFGENFAFKYDSFKVDLLNIDSLRLRVQTEEQDMYGYLLKQVNNTIEQVTGDLLIDKPENKSGLGESPEYPIFNSKTNSFIYYDDPCIEGGIYKREKFYFELYPYTIDSLDNFNSRELEFEGRFFSAGIFPEFEDKVKLQDDYSLGFRKSAPPDGFPVYEGKGKFMDEIHLSNHGLHGKGKLDYLTSSTYADDFLFYPELMKTKAREFTIRSRATGIQFPSVNGKNDNIKWLPYEDQMHVAYTDTSFVMMDNEAIHAGTLKLQPTGLTGAGRMILKKAELKSTLFAYNEKDFSADTADFKLKTTEKDEYTFITNNVNAHVDCKARKGTFASNDYYSQVSFKENLYIGFIDNFTWFLDQDKLEMSAQNASMALQQPRMKSKFEEDTVFTELVDGAKYVSVHPAQGRLSFIAPTATYNFRDNFINGHGVQLIHVADAYIYPGDGEIVVEKQAHMRTLVDAKIIANNATKLHTIYKAQVNINGRYNYEASGDYIYLDEDYRAQTIHFSRIIVDTSKQTIASGEIVEPDNFKLSPYFRFMGKAYLQAANKFLTFNGGVQLIHDCDKAGKDWLMFEAEINPLDIYIPVTDKMININRNKLFAGTFLTNDSIHMYSSFMGGRKNYNDNLLVNVTGFLYYDANSEKYKIGSKEKIHDQNIPGNYLSLHAKYCLLHNEGDIDPGTDMGQVKLKPVGSVDHDLRKDEVKLRIMLPVDFFFSKEAITTFAGEINSNQHLKPLKPDGAAIIKRLDQLIGPEKRKNFLEQPKTEGVEIKIPEELEHSILFGELKMKWNPETNSYRSYDKIGISSILNIPVNKYIDGYIEITKKRSGNGLDMFFKIDDNNWYYFNYFRGVMQTVSTNAAYIDYIKALKAKDRKLKVKSGKIPYIYMLSTPGKMRSFVNEFITIEDMEKAEQMAADSLLNDSIKYEYMEDMDTHGLEQESVPDSLIVPLELKEDTIRIRSN